MDQLIANVLATKAVAYFNLQPLHYGLLYGGIIETIRTSDMEYIKTFAILDMRFVGLLAIIGCIVMI